jgi:hypothetical protein
VLLKAKTAYSRWLFLYKRFPKPERFGVGEKMDLLFLEILESLFESRFASRAEKVEFLDISIHKIDKFKFFTEIAWENKLLKAKDYGEMLNELQSIGRTLGAWKKSLTKTPPM